MKKQGINKLLAFLLLSTLAFSQVTFSRQRVHKNYPGDAYNVRVQSEEDSGGLDVGKAD